MWAYEWQVVEDGCGCGPRAVGYLANTNHVGISFGLAGSIEGVLIRGSSDLVVMQ